MNDFLKKAGGVLGTVAPLLARAFGGPLAGTAAGLVIAALGLAPDTPPDALAEAVQNATPEQLLALKNADMEFKTRMAELGLEPARLDAADRQSARGQTVSLAQAGSAVQWAPAVVSLVVLATFGLVMWAALSRGLPPGSETILNMLLGTLAAMATAVVSYWVGSSAGSAAKTDMLFRSQPPPAGG